MKTDRELTTTTKRTLGSRDTIKLERATMMENDFPKEAH
jgi:hypothetical protein